MIKACSILAPRCRALFDWFKVSVAGQAALCPAIFAVSDNRRIVHGVDSTVFGFDIDNTGTISDNGSLDGIKHNRSHRGSEYRSAGAHTG